MLLSKIKRIKDPYRFWYEFLKRSKKYKKFCETVRAGQVPDLTEKNAKLRDAYFAWGDVFMNSFTESYKKFKINRNPITRKAVGDYKKEFPKRAKKIIQNFEIDNDREITVPELVNALGGEFKDQVIVLIIDPTRGSDKEIQAKVQEALGKKRSQPKTSGLPRIECINSHLSTDKPDIEHLKICLKVYDLKKLGMKYKQIKVALKLPEHGDVERNLKRYKAAAEVLIKNAEEGTFPGEYKPDHEDAWEYHVIV